MISPRVIKSDSACQSHSSMTEAVNRQGKWDTLGLAPALSGK